MPSQAPSAPCSATAWTLARSIRITFLAFVSQPNIPHGAPFPTITHPRFITLWSGSVSKHLCSSRPTPPDQFSAPSEHHNPPSRPPDTESCAMFARGTSARTAGAWGLMDVPFSAHPKVCPWVLGTQASAKRKQSGAGGGGARPSKRGTGGLGIPLIKV